VAFIVSNSQIISFATADDVKARDQRVFEANEGLTDESLEDMLMRSTDRIMSRLKASDWWRAYTFRSGTQTSAAYDLPTPDRSKLLRKSDWTELCVYHTLKEYLYPKIADFGAEGSAEVAKIEFYGSKFEDLWLELLTSGDFYDTDGDGTVESSEKIIQPVLYRRTRGRRNLTGVR